MSAGDPPAAAPGSGRPGRAETALLRAVLHILFGVWGLGVREAAPILGGVHLRTLFQWREHPEAASIDVALRSRLSALLGLYRALRRLHQDAAAQREWLRTPDADGQTPVARLMDAHHGDIRSLCDRVGLDPHGESTAR
ncbi:MAG: hypothetical protein V5A42_01975 [Halofilum sp. (in: g-proteobacteria)]